MLKHLIIHLKYLQLSIKTALEYRTNFIIQTLSMLINDIVWIIFWMIIFGRFSKINGWDMGYMIILYAVLLTSYGLSGVLFGNRNKIATEIVEGRLDYYITLPKNILYHVLTARSSWYSLGDLILGIVLAFMFIPLHQAPLFILLTILSMIIVVCYGVLIGSLAFFIENAEETNQTLTMALVAFSSYPLSIYQGFTRILILLIIPAGFLAGVPVELLKNFNLTWLLYMSGFTIILLIISVTVFYFGLRKYESGNLLYVRT